MATCTYPKGKKPGKVDKGSNETLDSRFSQAKLGQDEDKRFGNKYKNFYGKKPMPESEGIGIRLLFGR